jgi:hypothetical protein
VNLFLGDERQQGGPEGCVVEAGSVFAVRGEDEVKIQQKRKAVVLS